MLYIYCGLCMSKCKFILFAKKSQRHEEEVGKLSFLLRVLDDGLNHKSKVTAVLLKFALSGDHHAFFRELRLDIIYRDFVKKFIDMRERVPVDGL